MQCDYYKIKTHWTPVQVCTQVSYGIQALFGPSDLILGSHIQSLCDALDIPHLEARPDYDVKYKQSSLNLHPTQVLMNQAYKVCTKGWNKY